MTSGLPRPGEYFVDRLRELQVRLRDEVRRQQERLAVEEMSRIQEAREGDTIYAIDVHAEELLFAFCEEWGCELPLVLVAEGIDGSGARVFPEGVREEEAAFRLLVDPIDGTRVLMYNKRSAWSLAGVAPNLGSDTRLCDIEVAAQTELPTTRSHLSDQLWAIRGQGAHGETHDLQTGARSRATPAPSRAGSLAHGFAAISKFFPGGKVAAARLEEALFEQLLGPPRDGNPLVFDDEYVASGGQLYELTMGHDRFLADLRPILHAGCLPHPFGVPASAKPEPVTCGEAGGGEAIEGFRLCCHPYDLASELVAREAGVIVTGADGGPLAAPFDIRAEVAWIGYANEDLRRQIEPVLHRLLAELL